MTFSPDHRHLADEIAQMIRCERYIGAQEIVPRYAEALLEACAAGGAEVELTQAISFLQTALITLRAKRTHDLAELTELKRERAYLNSQSYARTPTFDVTG